MGLETILLDTDTLRMQCLETVDISDVVKLRLTESSEQLTLDKRYKTAHFYIKYFLSSSHTLMLFWCWVINSWSLLKAK